MKNKNTWEEKLTDLLAEEFYLATGSKYGEHLSGMCNVLKLVKRLKARSKKDTAREIVKELQSGGWPETITVFRKNDEADAMGSIRQITKAIINHYKI